MYKLIVALVIGGSINAHSSSLKLKSCRVVLSPYDTKYSCKTEDLSSADTAFVFVDFWEEFDVESFDSRIRAAQLLKQLREKNFFIIHGAGHAVLKEPAYQSLRKEVKDFLGKDYCRKNKDFGGKNRQALYRYRTEEVNCPESGLALQHLSRIVVPENRKGEFMVRYEDEMRFVLWKNKIKNLVFLGGAIDECLVHRPYGINALVGTDNNRMSLKIYLIEDLIVGMRNSVAGISEGQKTEILLKSLSYKLARLVSSQTFKFE